MENRLGHVAVIAILLAACTRDTSTASPHRAPSARQEPNEVDESELWRLVDASNSPSDLIAVAPFSEGIKRLPAEAILEVDQEISIASWHEPTLGKSGVPPT